MKSRFFLPLAAIALTGSVAFFPTGAGATGFEYGDDGVLEPIGDLLFGNSFGQIFKFKTTSTYFNWIAVQMVTPSSAQFENPAFRNFSQTGWTQIYMSPNQRIAAAGGPATTSLQFELWFPMEETEDFEFKMQAFSNGSVVSKKVVNYDYNAEGESYTWVVKNDPEGAVIPVPEAPALALLLVGLAGIVRRRRKV